MDFVWGKHITSVPRREIKMKSFTNFVYIIILTPLYNLRFILIYFSASTYY